VVDFPTKTGPVPCSIHHGSPLQEPDFKVEWKGWRGQTGAPSCRRSMQILASRGLRPPPPLVGEGFAS